MTDRVPLPSNMASKFPTSKKHHKKFAGHNPGVKPPRITRSVTNIRKPVIPSQITTPPLPPPDFNQPNARARVRTGSPGMLNRTRSHDDDSPVSNGTRSHGPAPRIPPPLNVPLPPAKARVKKNRAEVVKATAEIYRFLPKDMPDDLGGLQVLLFLNSRASTYDFLAESNGPTSLYFVGIT